MNINETKRRKNNFHYIIGGGILIENFVFKQSKLFILIVVLVVLFISNKYSFSEKLITIEALEEQLKDIKYENLVISAKLISHCRLSQVEKLLESKGVELFISKIPAFELYE